MPEVGESSCPQKTCFSVLIPSAWRCTRTKVCVTCWSLNVVSWLIELRILVYKWIRNSSEVVQLTGLLTETPKAVAFDSRGCHILCTQRSLHVHLFVVCHITSVQAKAVAGSYLDSIGWDICRRQNIEYTVKWTCVCVGGELSKEIPIHHKTTFFPALTR